MGPSKPSHNMMLRKTWDRMKKAWSRIGVKGDGKQATQPLVEVEVDPNEQRQQKLDRLMEEIQQLTKDLTPEDEVEETPGPSQCSDLEAMRLRAHSGQCMAKEAQYQLEIEKLKRMLERERDEHQKKESLIITVKEENVKKNLELLESGLSCAICKEVFIQATITECGHTFCSFCINEWCNKRFNCPVCRTSTYAHRCRRHTELDHFITRMFDSFDDEISTRRMKIVKDREVQK